MNQSRTPSLMSLPKEGLQYARSYVLDQPYSCVVNPCEALKIGTIFPFLLETYAYNIKKAMKGEEAWKS